MNTRVNFDDEPTIHALSGAACLLMALFLFRLSPAVGLAIFLVGVGLLAYAGYQFGRRKFREQRSAKADKNSFGGRIKARLAECRRKEEQFRNEAHYIRERISSLRSDLEKGAKADEAEKARAQVLIKEFEAEFNLRHAKVSFFTDCIARLEELLARHQLHQSIMDRKRELEELRKSNFDDEAAMEETRYHLEQDTIQLDTIAELSKDIAVSFKAEQAEELRVRLEKLRGSLGKNPGNSTE